MHIDDFVTRELPDKCLLGMINCLFRIKDDLTWKLGYEIFAIVNLKPGNVNKIWIMGVAYQFNDVEPTGVSLLVYRETSQCKLNSNQDENYKNYLINTT